MDAVNLRTAGQRIENLCQYETVATMNGQSLTLVRVMDRTLDFHVHPDSDEAFLIVSGSLDLEFRDKKITLNEGDLYVIPKGTEHRPVITSEVTVLLIDAEGTLTAENTARP